MEKKLSGALSIRGAMEYLGDIGKTKMYELIKRGEISVLRIDSKPVILISELDEFLARLSKGSDDRRQAS
ncbi:MAG: hypothetical protein RLZZ138_496 [Actinomycetota bacterium]